MMAVKTLNHPSFCTKLFCCYFLLKREEPFNHKRPVNDLSTFFRSKVLRSGPRFSV